MNPYVNALLAALYIVCVVLGMSTFVDRPGEETILMPMTMLGLLTLSVAVMAFLFAYKPFQLYFDNRRDEALRFFLKTLGTFAAIVAVFIAYTVSTFG